MRQKLRTIAFCFLLLILSCARNNHLSEESIINFDHLNHLTETIQLNGALCNIVHIYAEYPDYHRVGAEQEGIACVDDVARATVIYLRYYEITGIDSVLDKAKKLLNFILYMQADDGEFYNFIDSNFEINRIVRTSQKSFNFWAARGYWALGFGYKVFKFKNTDFATTLKNAFLRCKLPIKNILKNYRQFREINHRKYPQWLINKMGADATSTLILGLVEYLKVERDPELEDYAIKLVEGIIEMQFQDKHAYNGAFLSWVDSWHGWGNTQTQALASWGLLLKQVKQAKFIEAATNEADNFYTQLLVSGYIHAWQVNDNKAIEFPQIAYGIRPIAIGLLRLYEATQNEDYAKLAGLAASWFMGNNAVKTQMYDPHKGRCFDGINDSLQVNQNAGAESTIEALYTMIEILNNPIAKKYSTFITSDVGSVLDESNQLSSRYRIFKNEKDEKIALLTESANNQFNLLEGEELSKHLK